MQVQEMVFCDKIKCIFVTVHFIFLRLNELCNFCRYFTSNQIWWFGTSVDIYVD